MAVNQGFQASADLNKSVSHPMGMSSSARKGPGRGRVGGEMRLRSRIGLGKERGWWWVHVEIRVAVVKAGEVEDRE